MFSDCQINNFKIISQIGSGAYGLVFRVLDLISGNEYAMKAILKADQKANQNLNQKKADVLREHLLQNFKNNRNKLYLPAIDLDSIINLSDEQIEKAPHYREISLHLRVHSHKNIVTIHNIFESSHATFILMDYYPSDLFTSIVDERHFATDGILIKKVFQQVCSAVEYCHSKNIYHCDIKPENILFDQSNNVYLCDFGLSTETEYLNADVSIGSSYYMAPERVLYSNSNQDYRDVVQFPTSKGDIWSLGIILINLTCIRNPWLKAHQNDDQTFHYFVKNPKILKNILPVSNELYQLLIKVLQINPYNRINVRQLSDEVSKIRSFTTSGPLESVEYVEDIFVSIPFEDELEKFEEFDITTDNKSEISNLSQFTTKRFDSLFDNSEQRSNETLYTSSIFTNTPSESEMDDIYSKGYNSQSIQNGLSQLQMDITSINATCGTSSTDWLSGF